MTFEVIWSPAVCFDINAKLNVWTVQRESCALAERINARNIKLPINCLVKWPLETS